MTATGKPMPWIDIFCTRKGLKEYRVQEGIEIPEIYLISAKRWLIAGMSSSYILGALLTYFLFIVLK